MRESITTRFVSVIAIGAIASLASAHQSPEVDRAAVDRLLRELQRDSVDASRIAAALTGEPTADTSSQPTSFVFTDTYRPSIPEAALKSRRVGPRPRTLALDDAPGGFSDAVALPGLLAGDVVDPSIQPLRIGRVADVAVSSKTSGRWTAVPAEQGGGRLWTATLSSPSARTLRLRIDPFQPPRGAELITWNASDPLESYGPVTSARARPGLPYWTQTCFSNSVRIEYYLPPSVTGEHHLTITGALLGYDTSSISPAGNVQRSAPGDEGGVAGGGGGHCLFDVNCDSAWVNEAAAVARIDLVDGGFGYVCGGAMVNRLPAFDGTPYFSVAYHCVSTIETANAMDVFWMYQSDVCLGTVPPLNTVPRTDGSTLLASTAGPDYTLLGLTMDNIPDGLSWLGWTTELPLANAPAVEIHHPAGVYTCISYGNIEGFATPHPNCAPNIATTYKFQLFDGGQMNGSSGGPVMTESDHRMRGHASCSETPGMICDPNEAAWAASLNVAYPALDPFLNAGPTVWVNPSYAGQEMGTQSQPWSQLIFGHFGVRGGGTLMLQTGTYPAYSFVGGQKDFVIRASGGSVVFE